MSGLTVEMSDDDRAVRMAYESDAMALRKWCSLPMPGPLSPILVSVVKDEREALPDFLRHYRAAGVERFAFIDNGSTDGTRAFLERQIDVDMFSIDVQFDWRRKQGWINRAFDYYGLDRWYIYADADEHIHFDELGPREFANLTADMERKGRTRVRGFLLDMYSELPLLAAAGGDGVRLVEAYPYFDASGYSEIANAHLISRVGGPRVRAFAGADPEFKPQLTKYPLFRLRAGEFMANPHYLWPCHDNFNTGCELAILHFKFHGDFAGRLSRAVSGENYWDRSREYKAYLATLEKAPHLSLYNQQSARFAGVSDLVAKGLISPVRWQSAAEDSESVICRAAREHRAARLADLCGVLNSEIQP